MNANDVYETIRAYCNMGRNRALFDTIRLIVDRVPDLLISSGGKVFFNSHKPPKVRNFRSLTPDEICAVYLTLNERLRETIEAINLNRKIGLDVLVSGKDFKYIFDRSIEEGIKSCDAIRGHRLLPRQFSGSYESGERS